MNRRALKQVNLCSIKIARNLACIASLLVFIGLVASVGCRSATNRTAHAASNASSKTVTIPIEGMSCLACMARVSRTLKEIPGVQAVNVNLEHRNARVRYLDGQVSPERLVNAINRLGYKAGLPVPESK